MILVVEDDPSHRRAACAMLTAASRPWVEAESGAQALDLLKGPVGPDIRLVLLDLALPDAEGAELLGRIRAMKPNLPVIVLTGLGSVANAVAAMRGGAQDFLIKPVSGERLETAIRAALAGAKAPPRGKPSGALGFDGLVAESPATAMTVRLAARAAQSTIPVLIEGESGVGKEVFARAIHAASERAEGPFVAVNCGALPDALIESLLFGHEKGAFTGAVARRIGKFEEADGGTLFLDEIGELPLGAQVKLLRAIQEGEIDPVGGARTVRVDIRLVSATNRDLASEVASGRFREDLFYRIGVFPLTLPPLRARREDIVPLAERFLVRFAEQEGKKILGFDDRARALLLSQPWPGNVRQLENAVYRAVVLSERRTLGVDDFAHLRGAAQSAQAAASATAHPFFDEAGHIRPLADIEADVIEAALARYDRSMSEAARRLGVGRSTIYRRLRSDDPTEELPAAE
mgnify:CR=1 FL=1